LKTDDGSSYFWNKETNGTSWDRPSSNQYSLDSSNYYETDFNDGYDYQDPPGGYGQQQQRPLQVFASSGGPSYGNNFGPNYYAPPKSNQPLGSKPERFQPDVALKTQGSHTSISLPMGVTKMSTGGLKYEDFQNFKWDSMKANTIQGEKTGYLDRLKGTTWYTQWFVLKGTLLYWFQDQLEKFPQGEIPLPGALIEEDQLVKRSFAIHIFVHSTKRHYCLVPGNAEEFTNWMGALRRASSGQSSGGGGGGGGGPPRQIYNSSGGYERSNTFGGTPADNYSSGGFNNSGGRTPIPNPGYRSPQNESYPNSRAPARTVNQGYRTNDDYVVSYDPRGKEFNPPNLKPGMSTTRDDSSIPNRPPPGNTNRANDRANWEQHETNDGYMYYWNRVTGESSWDCPY